MKQIVLVGGRPDTGNHGCTALSVCAATGLLTRIRDVELTVFDLGKGMRARDVEIEGRLFQYRLWGAVNSRKIYKSSAFWNMRCSAFFGLPFNEGARVMKNADVIFDVSSGDSFGDLYGQHRFYDDVLPKLIAIENKKKLVLLPQTYGPYREKRNEKIAQKIVRNSYQAWARDEHSFDILKDLLGQDFDSERHHSGVDLAFLMPAERMKNTEFSDWFSKKKLEGGRLIGLNVSGLLYGHPEMAARNYSFKASYEKVIDSLIDYILKDSQNSLVLVPHVEAGGFHDRDVSEALGERLVSKFPDRVAVIPVGVSASKVKGVISQLDWFCGTRMHSTIAAISSCVPTVAIAYSLKTKGVFETCGQGAQVVDPRVLGSDQLLAEIVDRFADRASARNVLLSEIPRVKKRAVAQMDKIAACVE